MTSGARQYSQRRDALCLMASRSMAIRRKQLSCDAGAEHVWEKDFEYRRHWPLRDLRGGVFVRGEPSRSRLRVCARTQRVQKARAFLRMKAVPGCFFPSSHPSAAADEQKFCG